MPKMTQSEFYGIIKINQCTDFNEFTLLEKSTLDHPKNIFFDSHRTLKNVTSNWIRN